MSNLSAQSRKLYRLGVGEVSRSSLARVNAEKPCELCEALFGRLLSRCRALAPGRNGVDEQSAGGERMKRALRTLQTVA